MSEFTHKVGETFLAEYSHGGPLAGVTITSSVRCGTRMFPLTFTVIDAELGLGTLTADTTGWHLGDYLWDVKAVASGITVYTETRRFTVETPVTP